MSTTPLITIYVRHSAGCKYAGDEFAKRCQCRKWLRWTQAGVRRRVMAKTRTWSEAEQAKRAMEDQLAGRKPSVIQAQDIAGCASVFVQDKQVQGLSQPGINKYKRLLKRLEAHCATAGVYTIQGVTRPIITTFMSRWPEWYPSTITRSKTAELLRSFFRYCHQAEWLSRVPEVPTVKVDEPETQPLTPDEYTRLLAAVVPAIEVGGAGRAKPGAGGTGHRTKETEALLAQRLTAFLETMRWTGLAIQDTATLRRSALTRGDGFDLVTTQRKKTGTPVAVPIPPRVGDLLRAMPDIGEYFFWSGKGKPETFTGKFGQRFIVPTFNMAGIVSDGHMVSHRLRDTFAVDLLEKGVPMEEVSRLLGHTSMRVTEKSYAKWSKGRQDRVNALVSKTW